MKLATSYFAQIRNFEKHMIPLSTAAYDPPWFHNNQGKNHVYLDKRGIINGLRVPALAPDNTCNNICIFSCIDKMQAPNCPFLLAYKEQLKKINKEEFLYDIENFINEYAIKNNISIEPIAVFIVYEKFDNLCSERSVIQEIFNCQELEYPIQKIKPVAQDFVF